MSKLMCLFVATGLCIMLVRTISANTNPAINQKLQPQNSTVIPVASEGVVSNQNPVSSPNNPIVVPAAAARPPPQNTNNNPVVQNQNAVFQGVAPQDANTFLLPIPGFGNPTSGVGSGFLQCPYCEEFCCAPKQCRKGFFKSTCREFDELF